MQSDAPAPAFLRLFLAIAIPPKVRQEIGRARAGCSGKRRPGAVRWTGRTSFTSP